MGIVEGVLICNADCAVPELLRAPRIDLHQDVAGSGINSLLHQGSWNRLLSSCGRLGNLDPADAAMACQHLARRSVFSRAENGVISWEFKTGNR
jgi:hypothetical protein